MALAPVDVFNILVWTLKLGVAAWYYLAYPDAGAPTALLCGQLLEGALGGFWAWIGHRYVYAVVAAVLTHGTILLGCAETHFIALHEDGNWAVNNVGFSLLMVDDIGSVLLKSALLLLASGYGAQLDAVQLYATAAVLAAALWFTYRYFTEVWPNREKVYVPEPWKGD